MQNHEVQQLMREAIANATDVNVPAPQTVHENEPKPAQEPPAAPKA
jgi:hypothetical protein